MYSRYQKSYPTLRTYPKSKKPSYKKKSSYPTTKKLSAMVKNVVQSQAEVKQIDYFYSQKEIYPTGSASFTTQVLILNSNSTTNNMVNITQGTQQGQRIGNKVATKKAYLRGSVIINPTFNADTNYNPCPMYVTMWIMKLKPHLTDDISTLSTVVGNTFFQNGSTSVGFSGSMVDMCKVPNQQHVTVLKKRTFLIGNSEYVSASGSNVSNTLNQRYANNDSSMCKMFSMDITKIMPATQNFNDGTNNAVDRNLWLFFSIARTDGGLPVTQYGVPTGPVPAYSNIGFSYQYTDI